MRFENKSLKLLSITKSKAKMYEFGLDEEHHIHLLESPNELLLMTIAILGDLCREELSEEVNPEYIEQRRLELRNAARYFDALVGSKLQSNYDYYLCLLGSASYYLADMPGSAAVLAEKTRQRELLTESGLENILSWLLLGQKGPQLYGEGAPIQEVIQSFYTAMAMYMSGKASAPKLNEYQVFIRRLVSEMRTFFHSNGTDRELLIADIIASIVMRKLKNSSINLLPAYSDLPLEQWLTALSKETFINELWPAQRLLGEAGVFRGTSAVVQLPTSAGKTKSAELVIRSAFLSERASTAVIIAPFRSLCREITDSLNAAFKDEEVLVNQLNDVPQIDEFDIALFSQLFETNEAITPSPSIVVATPEKLVYLLRHKSELAEAISLVIYDEGHQFDTGSRGVTYELLLTSLKQKLRSDTQHLLISAVLSNAASIGDWLYAGEGEVVNGAECLSTERSVAFSSWRTGLGQFHYVEPLNPNSEEFFVPRVLASLPIPLQGNETVQRFFPPRDDKSLVAAYLGIKLSQHGPVAVFCGQKSSVIKICREVIKPLDRVEELRAPIVNSNRKEIEKIGHLAKLHLGASSVVTKAIQQGILPHSANIPNGLRISVEFAMDKGFGQCVICTSTLAQGVNLPIKYLVVSGVFQGEKLISTRDFHNLLGRAGRAGKHTEGSIIFADTELFDQRRTGKRRQWDQVGALLDPTKSEHCTSSLLTLVQPFHDDPFNVDPIKFLESPEKYEQLCLKAATQQNLDISSLIKQMEYRLGFIKSLESFLLANSSDDTLTEEALAELSTDTFAYSIANNDEKKKLKTVFTIVAERVRDIAPEKRAFYGKALLGIKELEKLEAWLNENIEALKEEHSLEKLLEIIWPVIEDLGMNNNLGKLLGEGAGLFIARLWCSGISYQEILRQSVQNGFKFKANTQQRRLKIENIIEICDSCLGYDAMLLVGACADLLESIYAIPDTSDSFRRLQASLRVGLDDELEKWLYSKGLADRIIARDIGNIIRNAEQPIESFDTSVFEKFRDRISERLNHYPSVFHDAVYG
ncbi:DEAD/DEAH box helicase [Pseudoalteromonas sp. PB2-1]|uniref:DEAD/DEAH box helicase n=1 Tax=Pseudoalteromonas sp. PB2-1 TaxID=2907242 RepID=UPI0038669DF7